MGEVKTDALSARLIDEAARLLAEEGPAGLSLRRVAAAAGTSTMAVYTRFGDKEHLLAAMHREGFRRLQERLRRAAEAPGGSLAELGRAYRLSALESPHLYGLMFGLAPTGLDPADQDHATAASTFSSLLDGVHGAVDAGVLVGDPYRIARHLWVVVHGMVSLELSGQLPVPADEAAAAYDDALMLAARPFLPEDGEMTRVGHTRPEPGPGS